MKGPTIICGPETIDLRCPNKLHGRLETGTVEIACRSSRCGYMPGVVILHVFDLGTGELLDTRAFRVPQRKDNGA